MSDTGSTATREDAEVADVKYEKKAQKIRAAVLCANDGIVSTACMMLGMEAVNSEPKSMSGISAIVGGSSRMAIGDFVTVSAQRDVEAKTLAANVEDNAIAKKDLPNSYSAVLASAGAFVVGGMLPLMSYVLIRHYNASMIVAPTVACVVLPLSGGIAAYYGRSSVWKGCVRVLVGGVLAMVLSFILLKAFGRSAFAI